MLSVRDFDGALSFTNWLNCMFMSLMTLSLLTLCHQRIHQSQLNI